MKTSIDLLDELLIPAKKRAAEIGCSLRALIALMAFKGGVVNRLGL